MKNFIYIIAILLFSIYWASTLLYCSPTNYVRIQFDSYMSVFENFFYQRWTFFTPPPKDNQRLYFYFYNPTKAKYYQCEVIKPLQDKKREAFLFNTTYEVLDDIVSGCAISLNNNYREVFKYVKHTHRDSTNQFLHKETMKIITKNPARFPGYQTLINYAKVVARKQTIPYQGSTLRIVLVSESMASFRDRFKKIKPTESLVFSSPIIKL